MRIKLLILTFLSLFFGARPVFAVAVTISNVPQTVTDQPFNLDVSIAGASSATNYLRVDFFQPNDTNYFGFTYNGSVWYNGSDYNQYLPITITSSVYSGTVQAKIDITSTRFIGNGTYNLKIRRYTQSGNYTAGESNIVVVNVNFASPTPSPPPTTDPSLIPTSSPTPNPSPIFSISGVPSQINSDQSFSVQVNLTLPSSPDTAYYLTGAFKKVGGTRYFSLTKKDAGWIQYGDDYLNKIKIVTDSNGSWSSALEVKPDIDDTDYKGSGDYIFKAGRYTASGSGPTWSNESAIKINDVNDVSGDSSTPKPTLKAIPSDAPSSLPSESPTVSSQPKSYDKLVYHSASVAGTKTSATPSATAFKNQKQTNPIVWTGLIFIFAGIGSIGYIYLRKNGRIPIKF